MANPVLKNTAAVGLRAGNALQSPSLLGRLGESARGGVVLNAFRHDTNLPEVGHQRLCTISRCSIPPIQPGCRAGRHSWFATMMPFLSSCPTPFIASASTRPSISNPSSGNVRAGAHFACVSDASRSALLARSPKW